MTKIPKKYLERKTRINISNVKSVRLTEEQMLFLQENKIIFSYFVHDKLEKLMKDVNVGVSE